MPKHSIIGGLSPEELEKIQEILGHCQKLERAQLFGSRAINTHKATSDIDLALFGENLSRQDLNNLKIAFEDSTLPHTFDLIPHHTIKEPKLLAHIQRRGVDIYRRGFYLGEDGEWIPEGWSHNYWEEEITLRYGKAIKGYQKKKSGYPVFGTNGHIGYHEDKLFDGPAIILGRKGVNRGVEFSSSDCWVVDTAYGVEPKKGNDPKWLYYKLIADKIGDIDDGSPIPSTPRAFVYATHVNLPEPPEQKAIAAVLSSLDDKIELLREQNATLEALAQTIFKRWFIDFNFPTSPSGKPYKDSGGKMVASELGEIPEGWLETELGQIVTVKRGGSPRPIKDFVTTGNGLRWLKISDASATNSPYIYKIAEKIILEGLSKTTHLNAGRLVLSNSATPGIPKFLAVDSCIHDGWLHFPELGHLSQEYLYLLFLRIRPELLRQGNGSVFTNLKTDILKQHVIIVPKQGHIHEHLLHGFSKFFRKIKANTEQIQTLTKIRDTLLPKLMKGEIRIPAQNP